MAEGFPSLEEVQGDLRTGLLLLCDHASNALPPEYGSLGLPPEQLRRHIAYDIGARDVTLGLARRLGAPALLTTCSRLLVDPNRGEDDPTVIMQLSDGAVIPGNYPLTAEEIENRLARFHRPYHARIDQIIDGFLAAGIVPAVFSVHSFTPRWKQVPRPWQLAVLWDNDPRMVKAVMAALAGRRALTLGDNEPYDGALKNDTMYRHCTARGLAHALIEIRQDLIADAAGVEEWCDLLAPALESVNTQPQMHVVRHFGSRTGPVMQSANPYMGSSDGQLLETAMTVDDDRRTEFEAAAFRRLVQHLRERSDVQNIDLMELAGFCRNCLSRWYQEAANERGVPLDQSEAREIIYGMPYEVWREKFQKPVDANRAADFRERHGGH